MLAPAPKPRNVDKVDFGKPKTTASAAPKEIKPSKEDHPRTESWDPKPHCQEDVDKMLQAHYETSKKFSQSKTGHFVGGTMIAGGVSAAGGGFVAGTAAGAATTFTETGEKVSEKIVEKILDFGTQDPRIYDDDMELF